MDIIQTLEDIKRSLAKLEELEKKEEAIIIIKEFLTDISKAIKAIK